MHLSYLIPIITLSLGTANAMPIEEDGTLEARIGQCNPGIDLIKLTIKPGKSFTGVGKPGKCYNLPANIKNFDVNSDDTKSLVSCFDCKVYTEANCKGSFVSLEQTTLLSRILRSLTTRAGGAVLLRGDGVIDI